MFGFLKDKLKKVISGISERIKKKEVPEEKVAVEKPERKEEIKKEHIKEKEGRKKEKEEVKEEKRAEEGSGKVSETKEVSIEEVEKEEALSKEEKPEEGEKPEKKGFFERLREKFQVKLSENDFNDFFSELETTLMENSVALEVIDALRQKLRQELVNKQIKKKEFEEKIKQALGSALSSLLLEPFDLIEKIKSAEKPYIIVFFGINGSGKTTTIAKVCRLLQKQGLLCVIAASDTFRAASIEQLEKHADALEVKLIKHRYGADPAAVAFDAIAHAKASALDVVLIDTAGRMQNQANLMREMEKIVRVAKPNMKIFIGEAIVGNDAVEQARSFNEAIGVDAIILSKADVDEKGGASISTSYVTGKPILFLGTGQKYGDLEKFNKQKILESLGLK